MQNPSDYIGDFVNEVLNDKVKKHEFVKGAADEMPSFKKGGLSLYAKMSLGERSEMAAQNIVHNKSKQEVEKIVEERVRRIVESPHFSLMIDQRIQAEIQKRVGQSNTISEALADAERRSRSFFTKLIDEKESELKESIREKFDKAAEQFLGSVDVAASLKRDLKQSGRRLIRGSSPPQP